MTRLPPGTMNFQKDHEFQELPRIQKSLCTLSPEAIYSESLCLPGPPVLTLFTAWSCVQLSCSRVCRHTRPHMQ